MYRFASATTLRAGALESEHSPRARRERDAQWRNSFKVLGDGVTADPWIQDVLGTQERPRTGICRILVESEPEIHRALSPHTGGVAFRRCAQKSDELHLEAQA